MDAIDETILVLLSEDARRTYQELGEDVRLSPPAVKRRIDRLRASGTIKGFTTTIDYRARGWNIEAFVHLFFTSRAMRERAIEVLREFPQVVAVWMITGEADAVAHVRARDAEDLEAFTFDVKRKRLVERTQTEVILSELIAPRPIPA